MMGIKRVLAAAVAFLALALLAAVAGASFYSAEDLAAEIEKEAVSWEDGHARIIQAGRFRLRPRRPPNISEIRRGFNFEGHSIGSEEENKYEKFCLRPSGCLGNRNLRVPKNIKQWYKIRKEIPQIKYRKPDIPAE